MLSAKMTVIRIFLLDEGQSIGLALDAQAGIISLMAVALTFMLIFVSRDFCYLVNSVNGISLQIKVYRRKQLVQQPMDLFIVNLKVICKHS